MSKADLHIHSTASDGRFTPAEVVARAAARGVYVISLADHDALDGIQPAAEAARAFPGLRVIPGVELNTDVPQGEVHVLGYFIEIDSPHLNQVLERSRTSRVRRAQGMVAKLQGLGMDVSWERVKEIAGNSSFGRPHIAQALLEKGYISSIKEAFTRYIGREGPAYVEREKLTPAEAAEAIVRAKGLPVLAHALTAPDPERMVRELKAVGLVGLEAYYNGYSEKQTRTLVNLARKYKLIMTGGSDFHGLDESAETPIGGVEVPMKGVEELFALARERGREVPQ